ncbi:surface antigen BspA-like [Trichomonas vaginalis G3]|uniref:Surface antigen BspA-like n=1 Tax=Trichomonas vaginalis (strain ATCC PRA-98 / G3) TaxID=412133 RepID=A2DPE2_TRIV3|nr:leucine-rich repeats (6 copies)-containing protein [Trichomonas vaginalis G3]EAY17686.1 surface antigen BspA-like [Trichomonas vaginalis G3]KAI5507910.1 leucine-rich repeats (6 copies)-containing protein [Trichomonas vaginalis G3]|eukprot:XP_001329821.1 surface antigen BspA-like [Trichomonas vaginalis G3]
MFRSSLFSNLLSRQVLLNSAIGVKDNVVTVTTDYDYTNLLIFLKNYPEVDTLISISNIVPSYYPINRIKVSTIKIQGSANSVPSGFLIGNRYVKSVELSKNVTSIGPGCFKNSAIQNITIDGNISSLGEGAFYGCSSLTELSIMTKTIPNTFAANCFNLAKITISEESITIGSSAFAYCYSLAVFSFSKVTSIADKAFQFSGLNNATFPASVESIGVSAFAYSKIDAFTLEGSNVSIGDYAFQGTQLTEAKLTNVPRLGKGIFTECPSLESIETGVIEIPEEFASYCTKLEKVTANSAYIIGVRSFYNCIKLESITLNDNETTIKKECFMFCEKLDFAFKENQIYTISDYAFSYCSKLKLPSLHENTTVGNYAFIGCDKIEELTINWGLTSFGIFMGCKNLETVTYTYNSSTDVNVLPDYTFCNCSSLSEFIDKSVLSSVNSYAFASTNIKEINLFNAFIANYAFADGSLKKITLAGVSSSQTDAFYNCDSLKTIVFSKIADPAGVNAINFANLTLDEISIEEGHESLNISNGLLTYGNDTLVLVTPQFTKSELRIPESVTYINHEAFITNRYIKKLYIPFTVYIVDSSNIIHSTSIEKLEISFDSNATFYMGVRDNKKLKFINISTQFDKIGDNSFSNNENLEEVVLPSTITEIGNYAFNMCPKLKTINIENVSVFGEYAFNGTALKTFDFSKMISQTVPAGILGFCSNLKEVKGTSNITTVDEYAFSHCESLKKFESSILYNIMSNAFEYCTSLKEINFKTIEYIYPHAFTQCTSLKSVELTTTVNFPLDASESSSFAFSFCTSLKSIDLTGLNIIPVSLFYGCSSLKEVTFSSGLIEIGSFAFSGCGFKEITIPDSVTLIGSNAFGSNSKLKTATIGKGTPSFDNSWFAPATQTIKIIIPPSIKNIGSTVFTSMDNVKIEFSSENNYYDYQDQTLIGKIKKNLVTTVGKLGKVYEVPEQIRVIDSNAIKRDTSDDSSSSEELDLLVQSDGIARAAIIKIQSNISTFGSVDFTVQSMCYEGEYYLGDSLTTSSSSSITTIYNSYASENYLYNVLFGSENAGPKCSTSLSDSFKWRHIVGMSSAEIGLTVAFVIVLIALIVLVILYFVFPFSKCSSKGEEA